MIEGRDRDYRCRKSARHGVYPHHTGPLFSPLVKFGQRSRSRAGLEPVMRRKSGLPELPCPAFGEDTDPLSSDAGGCGCMCKRPMGNTQQLSTCVCCHVVLSHQKSPAYFKCPSCHETVPPDLFEVRSLIACFKA